MTAAMRSRYVRGDWNALCDRCGFEYKASQLVVDGDNRALRVCKSCYDPRHPFETLRLPIERNQVPWARPRSANPPVVIDSGIGFWKIGYTFAIPPLRAVQALTYASNGDGTYTVCAECLRHRFTDGDVVTLTGAVDAAYNGDQTITLSGEDRFLYTVSTAPAADENPAAAVWADGIKKDVNPVTFNRWLVSEWPQKVFLGEGT